MLGGIRYEKDTRRHYPNGALLTLVLDLTMIDGVGQSGLEQSLEKMLAGRNGRVVTEVDRKSRGDAV